ncbi:MAG: hypothetical protein R2695_01090 [Acidimicrobiales bacterium]
MLTDRGVIANLEAEGARARLDLASVEAELAELASEVAQLEEAQLRLADRQRFEADWGDGVPVPSGQAAEVRGELGALREGVERGRGEADRLRTRHRRPRRPPGRPRTIGRGTSA